MKRFRLYIISAGALTKFQNYYSLRRKVGYPACGLDSLEDIMEIVRRAEEISPNEQFVIQDYYSKPKAKTVYLTP